MIRLKLPEHSVMQESSHLPDEGGRVALAADVHRVCCTRDTRPVGHGQGTQTVLGGVQMKKRVLKLEGAACTLMENGDVLISRRRGRGVFVVAFGVALALGGVGLFFLSLPSEPLEGLVIGGLVLGLGVLLSSIGIRALTGPEISIVVADRLIRVGARGSQPGQTRSFDALRGPVEVGSKQSTFPSVTVRLRFDDGEPLSLFMTGDTKKAQEIVRWLEAAFAPQGTPSDCPACGAWNAPGSERCNECGVALEGVKV